ncbi:antitoxin [Actinoplanes sp. NPDC026670]|uniref:antitoxin n=1 Tax=Actinoplanes sp. NPDC026670 TaxID=3154700 RepID=UPI00340B57BF
MSDFLSRAKSFADQHDEKVDQALEKVGDQIDERTGNKYSEHIDRGVDEAQRRTGEGDTVPG